MATIKLSPDETAYLLGLLKEHLEYYRLLAGNGKCTPTNRAKLAMLEALEIKLRLKCERKSDVVWVHPPIPGLKGSAASPLSKEAGTKRARTVNNSRSFLCQDANCRPQEPQH
jgi:hypothetical protein